jgi:hypothetical protein
VGRRRRDEGVEEAGNRRGKSEEKRKNLETKNIEMGVNNSVASPMSVKERNILFVCLFVCCCCCCLLFMFYLLLLCIL